MYLNSIIPGVLGSQKWCQWGKRMSPVCVCEGVFCCSACGQRWGWTRTNKSTRGPSRFYLILSRVCVCLRLGAPLFNSNGFLRAGMAQNYYTTECLLFGNLIIGPSARTRGIKDGPEQTLSERGDTQNV